MTELSSQTALLTSFCSFKEEYSEPASLGKREADRPGFGRRREEACHHGYGRGGFGWEGGARVLVPLKLLDANQNQVHLSSGQQHPTSAVGRSRLCLGSCLAADGRCFLLLGLFDELCQGLKDLHGRRRAVVGCARD